MEKSVISIEKSVQVGWKMVLTATLPIAFSSALQAPVQAQTQKPPFAPALSAARENSAFELLNKSAAAYAKLDGLAMKFSFYNEENGKIAHGTGTIQFEKSGAAKITSSFTPANLTVGPAQDSQSAKSQLGTAMQRVPAGASVPLFALVQGKNPLLDTTYASQKLSWKRVRLLPDNGVEATASNPGMLGGSDLRFCFYFDANDFLLRRVDVQAQVKGARFANFTMLSEVQINPRSTPEMTVEPAVKSQ